MDRSHVCRLVPLLVVLGCSTEPQGASCTDDPTLDLTADVALTSVIVAMRGSAQDVTTTCAATVGENALGVDPRFVLLITCKGGVTVYLELPDLRSIGTGTIPLLSPKGYGRVVYQSPSTGSPQCDYEIFDSDGTLHVDAAQGGPAPNPAVVTNDFIRSVSITLATSGSVSLAAQSPVCAYPSVTASLRFDVTSKGVTPGTRRVCAL